MKIFFGKIITRFINRRYVHLLGFYLLFVFWWGCLPEKLFDQPMATVVVDENDDLLAAIIAEDGQWRFPQRDSVPYKFKTALISFEDKNFYSHLGISVRGLGRAMYQNIKEWRKVSGGSTLTMQLMRMSRNGQERNVFQKVIEMFQATRVEWRYSKEQILALYASNAPMGGNVVGLDAAAWRYFGRSPENLTWAESATLAVLPNAPGLIHPGKNRDALTKKRNRLLKILFEKGEFSEQDYQLAKLEPLPEKPYPLPQITKHLLTRFLNDGQKGKRIETTVDKELQSRALEVVKRRNQYMSEKEIYNMSVLIMETKTGKVKAYIGNSEHPENAHGNAVDVITAARSSGSILKPFLYCHALEKGDISSNLLLHDVPTYMNGYAPKNYYDSYDGMVPANEALARSLNVPFVRLLIKHGIALFHQELNQDGFTTINRPFSDYGSSLVLGGAEVSLQDLVNVYGGMAQSVILADDSIKRRELHVNRKNRKGNLKTLVDPGAAYQTLKAMLEVQRPDEEGEWKAFSSSSKIAWKTGTSFGFRDAWAVGVTPEYTVGVWVGNADGEGRPGIVGVKAAAPVLFDIFDLLGLNNEWFDAPYDLQSELELCSESGYRANDLCTTKKKVFQPRGVENVGICPFHTKIYTDKKEEFQLNKACVQDIVEIDTVVESVWFVIPPLAEKYYKQRHPNYKVVPPFHFNCVSENDRGMMAIIYPKPESTISVPTNFKEEKEKIIFEATHRVTDATIFWHLDDSLIGVTQDIHQLRLEPKIGLHQLTLEDDNGNSVGLEFRVK